MLYVNGQFAGYTDSNGVFSASLPEGNYDIGVVGYVDDYYDNYCHFDYPEWTTHTLQYYTYEGNQIYGGDVSVSLTSDKTVDAWYWSG
jgi:hypothetical protein